MALSRQDKAFAFRPIFVVTPRQVPIERALGNLVVFIATRGNPLSPAKKSVKLAEYETHLAQTFSGMEPHLKVVSTWLQENYLEINGLDKPQAEQVIAGLYPMHGSAIKLQRSTSYRDFNLGLFVYGILQEYSSIRDDLKNYLWLGEKDPRERDRLDLETLLIMESLEAAPTREPIKWIEGGEPLPRPYCLGHASVFANDISRLLSYKELVPRKELIQWLIALIGFHTALYCFKLFKAVPALLRNGKPCSSACTVDPWSEAPFEACPYFPKLYADAGDNYKSNAAELARRHFDNILELLSSYTHAHFTIKKLSEFAEEWPRLRPESMPIAPKDVAEVVELLRHPNLPSWADLRIMNVVRDSDEKAAQLKELTRIYKDPFQRYIELAYPEVHARQFRHHREFLDAVLGKNSDYGLLKAGAGPLNRRRFYLSGGLTELLLHLSILGYHEMQGFYTKRITVDQFLIWLENRYGILIDRIGLSERTAQIESALKGNLTTFKSKLREAGFFVDLSDASNVQMLKPRFIVGRS